MASSSRHKLNQFLATAICGNDILSSALYVSGIAILFSGVYAPLVFLIIAVVLFLYKKIYTEVVESLPLNGGAYNCLLNGTSKTVAAGAGVMTILSYIATAVISAKIALEYVHTIVPVPVITGTIVVLGLFALLVIFGIKDSAKVAAGIFSAHIITLVLFVILGLVYCFTKPSFFSLNLTHTQDILTRQGGLMPALYLAFSASLLGVSGFESSANFVEEQRKGVFRKTLRNMLLGVAIFNPLIALIVLNSLPFEAIAHAKDFLLADAARSLGGALFQYLVVCDAFLVLCGAVLTAYIGVSGLASRMALDNCLPSFLTKQNKRKSYPFIIMSFFILSSSILLITKGELLSLAGVYTISFLGVMSSFAIGNLILKETRRDLKRTYRAPIIIAIVAFLATFVGILGNIRIDDQNLIFFELYFIPAALLVAAVIYKDYLLRFSLRFTEKWPWANHYLKHKFEDTIEGRLVAFIHEEERLYPILNYINRNERGRNITLVHCTDNPHDTVFSRLEKRVPQLQAAGVFSHLHISLLQKKIPYGPKVISLISRELKIHKNRIFVGSVHDHHDFDYSDLGGVRIIV